MALRGRTTDDQAADVARGDDGEVVDQQRGSGVTARLLLLGVVAVLFVVFLAQSTETVPIEFLVWDGEVPLYVVLLVTMVTTALVTLAVAGIWRRKRRRQRTEREELTRLRRKS